MLDDSRQTPTLLAPEQPPLAAPGERRSLVHGPGEVVAGKYALTRFLARGGMGEVWQGTHVDLRTDVAVKFVDPALASDPASGPDALARFRFEAQISARLGARTRHVVSVHDTGTHEGVPYLVMEYVHGNTLDAEVETGGPMAPERFAEVLGQAADALGAAHALGIVHRDLKPSNLLLGREPDGGLLVKVADFGVAKAVGFTLAVDRPRETQAGQLVGSPAFMSPEQLRDGARVDPRSDIWSLGVVAYEVLTGRPCFDGPALLDVFAAIGMLRYRPASQVQPGLPRGIDGWIARALAPAPDDRFASVEEMARAFRALLASRARPSLRPVAAAVLVAVAAIGVGALFHARGKAEATAPAPPASAATVAVRPEPLPPTARPVPVPVNVADLPTVDTSSPRALPHPTPPVAPPVRTASSTTATPPAPPTPPTAAPVASTAQVPTPTAAPSAPPRTVKRIDPSEIQ